MNVQTKIETPSLYESDFHAWLLGQAGLLRRGDLGALDVANLLEEIESLGKSEAGEMRSRMLVILEHLLKYQFAADRDPAGGWKRTILTQRDDLETVFRRSPSLRRRCEDVSIDAYHSARKRALLAFEEYEPHRLAHYRGVLPAECPYTVEQILDEDWLSEPSI